MISTQPRPDCLQLKLDHASVPLTTSFTGGVLHITGVTGDLVGETSITTNSIYWYDNPVQIDTGVDVTFTNNIRLYVKGDLTINGSIQGIGAGVSGAAGVMGVTKSQGGVHADYQDVSDVSLRIRGQGTTLEGDYLSMPFFNIIVDSAGDSITGAPLDLRGTGGATGTSTYWQDTGYSGSITGGAVTQGGGGLLIVCRGISFGASGYIDTSGEDGVLGGSSSPTRTLWKPLTVYAGSSGGGAPGGVLILLDGNSATSGAGDGNFVQNLGDSPYVGDLVTSGNQGHYSTGDVVSGGSLGFAGQALNTSFWRVQYLPDTTAAEEDQSEIAATATAFSSTPETQNQPETTVQNLSTIQVNLTAPSDTNYDYSNVYYKESTQDAYQFVGRAKNSINLPPTVMDGSTYDIIAKPVSKLGVESPAYIHTTKTVSNTTGGATFVTGNYIAVGQTAYDTGNGAWIEKTASGVKASFGASAGDKVLIDNSAGSIVDITGKVTADSGSIGGWTISSTTLANSTNIILDATNKAISINSATYGNAGVQIQYNSGTPRIYAGNGSTKSFEFDGTDVILGKDIKGFGVSAYNNDSIYLAGMLQDAAIYTLTSGSATVTQNSSSISFFCPATASNYALFIYYPGYTLTSHSWDKNRRLKLRLKTQLNTNHDFEIGMGEVDQTTNNRQIGVRFDTDGNIYGRCADNTSATDTSLTTWSTATNYTLEIVLTAGSQVDFYLDGSAIGSPITTNIPTGTVYANYVTKAKLTFVSGAASSLAYVGEYKFQQDE